VTVQFEGRAGAKLRRALKRTNPVHALRDTGHTDAARRVVLNVTTIAMVSDTLHHLFEALHCLEKRKAVVALNLLRKPLMDSLLHLSWMLGDAEGFYAALSGGDPSALAAKKLGNRRIEIIDAALAKTGIGHVIDAKFIVATIFDRRYEHGLQKAFQHAVHLVTVDYEELRTDPENFNFIFKNPFEDDVYEIIYDNLAPILFYLSHVILELFDRMRPADPGAKTAFHLRAIYGLHLLEPETACDVCARFHQAFEATTQCPACALPFRFTEHNVSRILLTQTVRCHRCRRVQPFPFAFLF
jgi:hypothetical protein